MIDFLIIGGGVAGLAVANRLGDLNVSSLLIEAGHYPSQKVCGEFLSSECLPFLANWGIVPDCSISQAHLFNKHLALNFSLPFPAGSMSRYRLEELLLARAQKKGCQILCQTQVIEIQPPNESLENCYQIKLSDGKTLKAKNVFIGAGRLTQSPNKQAPKIQYMGFKAHFKDVNIGNVLQMHLLPNAYLGISQVENDVVNVACLAKVDSEISLATSLSEYLFSQPRIKEVLSNGKIDSVGWLKTSVPEFAIKNPPDWNNAYFIGDAAGTIPPATGEGLAMAITSGYLAANYALNQDTKGFKNAWRDHYSSRIRYGKILHQVMSQPLLSTTALCLCKAIPFLPKAIFSLTRS